MGNFVTSSHKSDYLQVDICMLKLLLGSCRIDGETSFVLFCSIITYSVAIDGGSDDEYPWHLAAAFCVSRLVDE